MAIDPNVYFKYASLLPQNPRSNAVNAFDTSFEAQRQRKMQEEELQRRTMIQQAQEQRAAEQHRIMMEQALLEKQQDEAKKQLQNAVRFGIQESLDKHGYPGMTPNQVYNEAMLSEAPQGVDVKSYLDLVPKPKEYNQVIGDKNSGYYLLFGDQTNPQTKVLIKGTPQSSYGGVGGGELIDSLAIQVIDGRLDPYKIGKRQGLQQAVFARVEKMFPGFDINAAAANSKFQTESGNLRTVGLINGVMPLFDNLLSKGQKLNNTDIKLWNTVKNSFLEQIGDSDVVAFKNARDGVVAELERILMGSGVLSDSKYQRALENINSSQSPPQLAAAVEQMIFELNKREEAIVNKPYDPKTGGRNENKLSDEVEALGTSRKDPLGLGL